MIILTNLVGAFKQAWSLSFEQIPLVLLMLFLLVGYFTVHRSRKEEKDSSDPTFYWKKY